MNADSVLDVLYIVSALYTTVCVFVFCFGAIWGSFLNVLLFRFNTGRGQGGRSACMRCGHTLTLLDLFPIFSFLFLRGKCRHCGTRISFQYPLVELAAALLSLGVFFLYPAPLEYVLHFTLWLTILFIVVYDLRHTIIPWSASVVLMVLSLVSILASSLSFSLLFHPSLFLNFSSLLWALVAGPLLALPLFLLSFVSGGRWMGWGDWPFELSLGWLLGLSAGTTALFLAVWSGAAVGLVLMTLSKRVTMRSEIPFAPFLALGALIVFFFHVNFFTTQLFF
ncbi:MAG: prepilin peptidase [bacterium]